MAGRRECPGSYLCPTHLPGPVWGMSVCLCWNTCQDHQHFGGKPENSQLGRGWNQVVLALPSQVHRFLAGAVPSPCVSHSFLICARGMRTVATTQNCARHQWDDETKHSLRASSALSKQEVSSWTGETRRWSLGGGDTPSHHWVRHTLCTPQVQADDPES